MEELLFQAALSALGEAFPDIPVFTEKVRQGYEDPAVFLTLSECMVKREMGNRFRAEGTFSLRAGPGKEDALSGAEMLSQLEGAFRGKDGMALSEGKVLADGTIEGTLTAKAIGFWQEDGPPLMGKMNYTLELGGGKD